jgi:hypothetical protein
MLTIQSPYRWSTDCRSWYRYHLERVSLTLRRASGFLNNSAPLYLSEIPPVEIRGIAVSRSVMSFRMEGPY